MKLSKVAKSSEAISITLRHPNLSETKPSSSPSLRGQAGATPTYKRESQQL
jgi:hypothetical protein